LENRDTKWISNLSFPSTSGMVKLGKAFISSSDFLLFHLLDGKCTCKRNEEGERYQEKSFSQWDLASVSHLCVMPYLESGSRDSKVGGGILESDKRVRNSVSWDSGMEIVKGVGWVRAPGGMVLYWLVIFTILKNSFANFK
jgi:hypothetical protein